jgi:hypothetical protein
MWDCALGATKACSQHMCICEIFGKTTENLHWPLPNRHPLPIFFIRV